MHASRGFGALVMSRDACYPRLPLRFQGLLFGGCLSNSQLVLLREALLVGLCECEHFSQFVRVFAHIDV